MLGGLKRKLVASAVVTVAVAGGGGAIAATQLGSPAEESETIVNDAARQLGVEPQALTAALKKAFANRVDAAVAAGRITKAEGEALKARIQSADFPVLGGPRGGHGGDFDHFGHHGRAGDLAAAATYLGLTEAALGTELVAGKTLADVAKAKGKSVDGLVDVLVTAAKKRLDAEVTAGRLTRAQADELAANLEQRITDLVNGVRPPRGDHPHGFGFGAPPPTPDSRSSTFVPTA